MVRFAFIFEGMSITPRPVLWSDVSQHHRTELVVNAGKLNAVRNKEDIFLPHVVPFLQDHPDMTLQPDTATSHTGRSVRESCKTGMSVF